MNELQLVGYTADLKFLVFSDVTDGARCKVPVDDDLVATLSEVLQLADPDRDPFRRPAGDGAAEADPWEPKGRPAATRPAPPATPAPAAASEAEDAAGRNGKRKGPQPGIGALAAFAVLAEQRAVGPTEAAAPEPEVRSASRLSPREIQALLRSGFTVRQVAKRAETDEAWVRKWLAPIEAERKLVLQAVEQARVVKSRLGPSKDLLGEAVRRNLAEKGVRDDDGAVEWAAARREGDAFWVVTLRYRSRGRNQRAVWHFDPDTGELEPRNALAVDVAWTRPRKGSRGRTTAPAPATHRPVAKNAAGKKASAKKTAKKAAAKKTAAKKTAAKKAGPQKVAAKKAAAKKAAGTKAAARTR